MSRLFLFVALLPFAAHVRLAGDDPPALNPFAPKAAVRDDAVPGYIELSNGAILPGHIHITRDARLKIYDEKVERQREIPWNRIRQIDCTVQKEWLEKEWRFVENANDRKVFTGRTYPSRIYVHTITLSDGRKIQGPLSAVIYLQRLDRKTQKYLLHKRDKGEPGYDLESLRYVKSVRLGPDALKEGQRRLEEKASAARKQKSSKKRRR